MHFSEANSQLYARLSWFPRACTEACGVSKQEVIIKLIANGARNRYRSRRRSRPSFTSRFAGAKKNRARANLRDPIVTEIEHRDLSLGAREHRNVNSKPIATSVSVPGPKNQQPIALFNVVQRFTTCVLLLPLLYYISVRHTYMYIQYIYICVKYTSICGK